MLIIVYCTASLIFRYAGDVSGVVKEINYIFNTNMNGWTIFTIGFILVSILQSLSDIEYRLKKVDGRLKDGE